MNSRKIFWRFFVLLSVFSTLGAPRSAAQGAAPETAPTLFPGGALISYNSAFTTRGLEAGISVGNIANGAAHVFSRR